MFSCRRRFRNLTRRFGSQVKERAFCRREDFDRPFSSLDCTFGRLLPSWFTLKNQAPGAGRRNIGRRRLQPVRELGDHFLRQRVDLIVDADILGGSFFDVENLAAGGNVVCLHPQNDIRTLDPD